MKNFRCIIFAIITIFIVLSAANTIIAAESKKTVRIIYTNDFVGNLEPCHCGGKQLGGLGKRFNLISSLIKENPNTIIVDSGNLSNMPDKLPFIFSLMKDMHYDACGIGVYDISVGLEPTIKAAKESGIPIIDSSKTIADSVPFIIKEVAGIKIGIVSYGAVTPANKENLTYAVNQNEILNSTAKKCDFVIMLDQSNTASKEWIENNEGLLVLPDIVIGGIKNSAILKEELIGKTTILPTSTEGKAVGIVDVDFIKDKFVQLSARKVELDSAISEDKNIAKRAHDLMIAIRASKIPQPGNNITNANQPRK